jgi:hypothetical protein
MADRVGLSVEQFIRECVNKTIKGKPNPVVKDLVDELHRTLRRNNARLGQKLIVEFEDNNNIFFHINSKTKIEIYNGDKSGVKYNSYTDTYTVETHRPEHFRLVLLNVCCYLSSVINRGIFVELDFIGNTIDDDVSQVVYNSIIPTAQTTTLFFTSSHIKLVDYLDLTNFRRVLVTPSTIPLVMASRSKFSELHDIVLLWSNDIAISSIEDLLKCHVLNIYIDIGINVIKDAIHKHEIKNPRVRIGQMNAQQMRQDRIALINQVLDRVGEDYQVENKRETENYYIITLDPWVRDKGYK